MEKPMEIDLDLISKAEFVSNRIAKTPEYLRRNIAEYKAHAKQHGVRTCNDGYPDARFKATFGDKYRPARMTIAVAREMYIQMEHKLSKECCCAHYKQVSQEVAISNIEKIKQFFSSKG